MTTHTDPAVRALAVETDTARAQLDEQYARIDAQAQNHGTSLLHLAGATRRQVTRTRAEWSMTVQQAYDAVPARIESGEIPRYDVERAERARTGLVESQRAMDANRAEAARLDDVWAANGYWSRFFLVKGSNGHIHYDLSDNRCSRTPTTDHGWLPELSGLAAADAVEAYGPLLCSVCFPDAPVEWTVGKPKAARCPGVERRGRTGTSKRIGMRTYVDCDECGERQIATQFGRPRAHKPAK